MLLQILVVAPVCCLNGDQILSVWRESSGRFSLSFVPISYVVRFGSSSLLFSMT